MTSQRIAEIEGRLESKFYVGGQSISDITYLLSAFEKTQEEYAKLWSWNEIIEARVKVLQEVLTEARLQLSQCYNVVDWPANGSTDQDKAIRAIDAVLSPTPIVPVNQ